jgi:phosphatidylinositol glycan class C protein
VAAAAPPAAHAALTAALAAGAAALLARQSVLLTSAFCCALLFVTLICPMWLVRIHKFKAQINGPWDEAVPHLSRHLPRQRG